jgi:surface protein
MFYGCGKLSSPNVSSWAVSNVTNFMWLFYDCASIEKLDLSGWDTSSAESLSSAFSGCSSLKTRDVSGWNLSKAKKLTSMFSGCEKLESLDISGWNTTGIEDMSHVFYRCSSLTSLDLSGWDTSSVKDMGTMFDGCTSLETLVVSGWDTSSVTNMHWMFLDCKKLSSLDVSKWDVSNVISMRWTFNGCASLETLDVSNWNVSKVEDMSFMFDNCASLKTIDVSDWDVSSVSDMEGLFQLCESVESIDVSKWDVSNVSNMGVMFSGCTSLKSVDISGWQVSEYTNFNLMFSDSPAIEKITLGETLPTELLQTLPDTILAARWIKVDDAELGVSTLSNLIDGWDADTMPGTWRRERTVSVTYVTGEGDSKSEVPVTYNEFDAPTLDATAFERTGYVISGWSDGQGNTLAADADVFSSLSDAALASDQPVTLTAVWSRSVVIDETAEITIAEAVYDGAALEPAVTVMVGGETLVSGADYTCTYSDNTAAGTATVVIEGAGGCTGTVTKTFTISPRPVTLTSGSASKVYDGKALESPDVTVGGNGFVEGEATAQATGSITNLGSATNTIEVVPGTNYVASNYDIQKSEGTLTVTAERVAMFRLYNPNSGEHFYTSSEVERDATIAAGWNYEGIGWYAPSMSSTPVYRLYSGTDHHYTTSETERDALLEAGWIDEGIGWYSDDNEGVALYRQFNPYVDPEAETNNSGSHNYTVDKFENDYLVSLGWQEEGIAWYGLADEMDPAE